MYNFESIIELQKEYRAICKKIKPISIMSSKNKSVVYQEITQLNSYHKLLCNLRRILCTDLLEDSLRHKRLLNNINDTIENINSKIDYTYSIISNWCSLTPKKLSKNIEYVKEIIQKKKICNKIEASYLLDDDNSYIGILSLYGVKSKESFNYPHIFIAIKEKDNEWGVSCSLQKYNNPFDIKFKFSNNELKNIISSSLNDYRVSIRPKTCNIGKIEKIKLWRDK